MSMKISVEPASMTLSSNHIDDIDATEWLREVDMVHYERVFVTNFSIGGKLLSRSRLAKLRLCDFPKLNIQDYDDQKVLLDHIRHTLEYSFHSPVRKDEARQKYLLRSPNAKLPESLAEPKYIGVVAGDKEKKKKGKGSKKGQRTRRRSFDHQAWNKINALRTKDVTSENAAEQLRYGIKPDVVKKKEKEGHVHMRARRYSFGEKTPMDQLTRVQKGNLYGNMALEYDMIQKEMAMIKAEHLLVFQALINCESGRLYFVSEHAREMIVLIGHEWYRESMDSDLAGHCAQGGRVLNIHNVYEDHRFNRNMDTMTGFKTRNVLCMPIRANRGGGRIIGVVQMANKIGDDPENLPNFDDNDEQILSDCVQRIADDIHLRFQELMHAAEALTGASTLVADGDRARKGLSYATGTAASAAHERTRYHSKEGEVHSVHNSNYMHSVQSRLEVAVSHDKDEKRTDVGNINQRIASDDIKAHHAHAEAKGAK